MNLVPLICLHLVSSTVAMVFGYTLVYHKLQYNAKVFQVHMHAIHGDLSLYLYHNITQDD